MDEELLSLYIQNWDDVATTSLKALSDLLNANLAIHRVRELHKPSEVWAGNYECIECSPNSCGCCSYVEYPCPTIQVLDGEQ
jgi:hypothetical protein